ncbi:MAG: lipocalin family protein [Candidatus Cryptobacteroides sp.]
MKTSKMVRGTVLAASATFLASCSTQIKTEQLEGIWTQPVPGMTIVQGFELGKDGSARSVNMATLLYDSWKLEGRNLILNGTSIGNHTDCTFSDTLEIIKAANDSLVLRKAELVLEYSKCL